MFPRQRTRGRVLQAEGTTNMGKIHERTVPAQGDEKEGTRQKCHEMRLKTQIEDGLKSRKFFTQAIV